MIIRNQNKVQQKVTYCNRTAKKKIQKTKNPSKGTNLEVETHYFEHAGSP